MVAADILNPENRLPFFYLWTNSHQTRWESLNCDIERNCYIDNASLQDLKMAAVAILNF